MLYKVTPMMVPAATPTKRSRPFENGEASDSHPRKKRKAVVFDAEGNEVLITMMCLKCKQMRPLNMFGLRKMADGAIRNQPWCRGCRSGASTKAKQEKQSAQVVETAIPMVQAVLAADTSPPSVEQAVSFTTPLEAGPVQP
jgi:hypothetical protein